MKRILPVLFLSLIQATIIYIPEDYPTIQQGIDAAVEGDTVLVAEDTYFENLQILGKNFTLGSYYLMDGDTSHISNTVIDGSQASNPDEASVMAFLEGGDDDAEPRIVGFTITHGSGWKIEEQIGGEIVEKMVGGGIYIEASNPIFSGNYILDNTTEDDGAGSYGLDSTPNFGDDDNPDGNVFLGNYAAVGKSLYAKFETIPPQTINVMYSHFDVYSTENQDVSDYWATGNGDFNFQYGAGENEAITHDVWVNPVNGVDDGNIIGDSLNPFLTINYALSIIFSTEFDPITIYLTQGIYSPSETGEVFPIKMSSNINLIGRGEEVTILDAQQTDRVIRMVDCQNNIISDLTITGGSADGVYPDDDGGGMWLIRSNPTLTHVTISGNTSSSSGGGMWLEFSNATLTYVTIIGNTTDSGGGMSLYDSNPTLTHVTISGNTTVYGGGMWLFRSNPTLTHVTISGNSAVEFGGGMKIDLSNPTLTHVTISGNTSSSFGGGMDIAISNPTLTHVTISGNTTDYGGGISLSLSNPILENVTISDNSAIDGGGMWLELSNSSLLNCILWNDSPQEIYFRDEFSANSIMIAYSDIQGGEEGIVTNDNGTVYWEEGNIDENPLFTDPDNGDFTLQESSPCIDAGTSFFVWEGDTLVDLNPEDYEGNAPDMGSFESPYTASIEDEQQLPLIFSLYQNYPNPFNPVTSIHYDLPQESDVTLIIYDITGRMVQTLINDSQQAGMKQIIWNAADVSSGVYIYRIQAGDFTQTRKMILLK